MKRAIWELHRLRDYEGPLFLWRPITSALGAFALIAAAAASVMGGALLAADTGHLHVMALGTVILAVLPFWVTAAWRRKIWWSSIRRGLARWEDIERGDRFLNFHIASEDFNEAARALRRAGFCVPGGRFLVSPEPGAESELDAYWVRNRHLEHDAALRRATEALAMAGVPARNSGAGTSLGPGSVFPVRR